MSGLNSIAPSLAPAQAGCAATPGWSEIRVSYGPISTTPLRMRGFPSRSVVMSSESRIAFAPVLMAGEQGWRWKSDSEGFMKSGSRPKRLFVLQMTVVLV